MESPAVDTPSPTARRLRDSLPLVIVFISLTTLLIYLFAGGAIVSIDSAVTFYPLYHLLGERIGQGELPLWNPSILSGTPLLADPQSGWLYLPVMFSFTLLPIWLAAMALSGIHILLSAGGTYLLARTLNLGHWGAAAAAIAYAGSGWFTYRLGCCPADIATASFLPVAILCVELGLNASSRHRRIAALIGAGFAMAQMLAAWMGQGSYYGYLAIGGFLVYRALIDPREPRPWSARLQSLIVSGLTIAAVAFVLAAGGILPRLEFLRQSNLASGYPIVSPGWAWLHGLSVVIGDTSNYAGVVAVPLAWFGLAMLGRRSVAPFWVGLIIFAFFFSTNLKTPIHQLIYAITPMFERMQEQYPNRFFYVAYLGIAMLAGGAVDSLATWRSSCRQRWVALGGGVVLSAFSVVVSVRSSSVSTAKMMSFVLVVALLSAIVALPEARKLRLGTVIPAFLLLILIADLGSSAYRQFELRLERHTFRRVDLTTYYDERSASAFLIEATATEAGRFFGIDPTLTRKGRNGPLMYGRQFSASRTAVLVVNNRAMLLDLEDIQGVDLPMRIARYDDLISAINGESQDYHNATILSAAALDSPLFVLLNVRYIVVPNGRAADPELESHLSSFQEVYADARIRVLENQRALPRAWIVHDVRQTQFGETLSLLASGAVDGAITGLIENSALPAVAPTPAGSEHVKVTRPSPERIEMATNSSADGLLIVSEITYPAWNAYVDGKRVDLLTVDHALIGVPVPAGEHQVEIRFESRTATIGGAITGISLLLIAAIFGILGWQAYRNRRTG